MDRHIAPFTGAWIETTSHTAAPAARRIAPFTGAWIETCAKRLIQKAVRHRPLHGGVDCNLRIESPGGNIVDHSPGHRLKLRQPIGGPQVDRHRSLIGARIETSSRACGSRRSTIASLAGAWIETALSTSASARRAIAPFTGARIETCMCRLVVGWLAIAPFTGAWIETGRWPRRCSDV